MLFSAGYGTRMGALTEKLPKPLIRVGGRTLLDYTLGLAEAITPRRIVANAHYHHTQISRHLSKTDVKVSLELPDILETGGGLRQALPLLGSGTVFTANTDAIWRGENPFVLAKNAWDPKNMDALLVCVPVAQVLGHPGKGDFTMSTDNRLKRGPGAVYGGIQIIKTDGLHAIEQSAFSLNLLWDRMLTTQRVFGVKYPGQWCDVGSPAGLALAENLMETPNV